MRLKSLGFVKFRVEMCMAEIFGVEKVYCFAKSVSFFGVESWKMKSPATVYPSQAVKN